MTETRPPSDAGRAERTRALAARATRLERLFYASIWRAITRRPAVPPGARGFGFHKPALPLLIVFIALSVLELGILDLILRRWLAVRIVVDGLDAWALVWQIGLLCAFVVRPHTVGDDGIRVRNGLDIDVHVAWADVRAVACAKTTVGAKTPRVRDVDGTSELALRSQGETNVRIDLLRAVPVALPGPPPHGGAHTVDRIRVWADDPDAFVDEARRHL